MTFTIIDMDSQERKEYSSLCCNDTRCTYSVTANIDITELYDRAKEYNFRLFPVLIWWTANAVNHFEFLRFNYDENGNVGCYDTVNPSFTCIPLYDDKFHVLWCAYDPHFGVFYNRCIKVMDNRDAFGIDMPKNHFDISPVPWIEVAACNPNVRTDGTHLSPIFSTDNLIMKDQKINLPLCLQIHRSVCGDHQAEQCFSYLQKLANEAAAWM